jgi:hypothetical protein
LRVRADFPTGADAFEVCGDLACALMLRQQYLNELFVRAAGLPHFRKHILLLEDALVVVLPKLTKELRSLAQCHEIEVAPIA